MDTWRYVRTADHNIGHLTWIWKMRNVNSRNALHGPNEINHGIYGNSSSFFCLQQPTASREKRAAVTHAPGAECGPGPADHTAHRSQSMIWKTRIFPFLSMFRSGQMPLIVNYNLFLFYFILFFEKKEIIYYFQEIINCLLISIFSYFVSEWNASWKYGGQHKSADEKIWLRSDATSIIGIFTFDRDTRMQMSCWSISVWLGAWRKCWQQMALASSFGPSYSRK